MSAIQLLESIGKNPIYKSNRLANQPQDEITIRANAQIEDLLKSQGQIWCAFFPAEDEQPTDEEKEPDEEKDSIKIA